MKCLTCIEQGMTSQVFPGAGMSTCLGHDPYWDEAGVYHSHDPNWHSTNYRCSAGHTWAVSIRQKCPAPGCDFGKDDVKIARKENTNGE